MESQEGDATLEPQIKAFISCSGRFFELVWELRYSETREQIKRSCADMVELVRSLDEGGLACVLAMLKHADGLYGLHTAYSCAAETTPLESLIGAFSDALSEHSVCAFMPRAAELADNRMDALRILERVDWATAFEPMVALMRSAGTETEARTALRILAGKPHPRSIEAEIAEVESRWSTPDQVQNEHRP